MMTLVVTVAHMAPNQLGVKLFFCFSTGEQWEPPNSLKFTTSGPRRVSSGIPKTDRVLVGEGSEKSEDLEDVTT